MGDQAIEYNNGNNANDINDNDDDDDGDDHQQYLHHPPPSSSSSTLWESPPKLKQSPMTTYPIALEESPPAYSIPPSLRNKWKTGSPTTTTNWRSQIHGKSNADIAGDNSERSTTGASAEEVIEQTTNDQEPHRQQYPAISEEEDVIIDNDDDDNNDNNILLLQKFWRTYDTLIILSICSIIGIVFRMLSAKWFRLEMGSVFSEDSALGTNLPLNVWSCFLMGLLCSGREAMGIVRSKVFGGANPYGTGRGIIDVGKGAYRGVIDAGRAGITRARGRVGVHGTNNDDRWDSMKSPSQSLNVNNPSFRRRRGSTDEDVDTSASTEQPDTESRNQHGDRHHGSEDTIAGLLGLDDDFRIVGSQTNNEDEIRDVQLRALSRRIIASPSLAFFPAKKVEYDVMEHYDIEPSSSSKSMTPDDRFEIGNLNDEIEEVASGLVGVDGASNQRSGAQNSSQVASAQQLEPVSSGGTEEGGTARAHSISDHVTTIRRVRRLDGWDVDTSPEKMKHIILLGLRMGFCGALGTFASLNASVVRLLKAGLYGEALMGYAISIQLGVVSYRFGQHIAVYIFVWRCRRETKREERGGYGLRLRNIDIEEDLSPASLPPRTQEPIRRRYISVRSCATVLFVAMFVSLVLTIVFLPGHRQYLISLIFTPFGCLARWKLMNKYNKSLPGFPLGTFACNIGGCALSGSLASFLAGNPSAGGSVVLTSMIAGFAGSLSTFSAFVVEILSLIDPIIFKFDGVVYAMITILWAVIIGFVVSQAKNWADEI